MANLALKHYGEGFNGSMTSKGHGLYSQKQIALQFSYSIHLPLPVWSRFMGKDQPSWGARLIRVSLLIFNLVCFFDSSNSPLKLI
jgi:hypothetical protein